MEPKLRYPILAYFDYDHLPERLQLISRPFAELAQKMAYRTDPNDPRMLAPTDPETAAGLRKLLEAKDCFVRAALEVHE